MYRYEQGIKNTDTFKIYKRLSHFFYTKENLDDGIFDYIKNWNSFYKFLEAVMKEIFDESKPMRERIWFIKVLSLMEFAVNFSQSTKENHKLYDQKRQDMDTVFKAYTKVISSLKESSPYMKDETGKIGSLKISDLQEKLIENKIESISYKAFSLYSEEFEKKGKSELFSLGLQQDIFQHMKKEPSPTDYETMSFFEYKEVRKNLLELLSGHHLIKNIAIEKKVFKKARYFYDKDINFYLKSKSSLDDIIFEKAINHYEVAEGTEGFQMYKKILDSLRSSGLIQSLFKEGFDKRRTLENRLEMLESLKFLSRAFDILEKQKVIDNPKKSEAKDIIDFVFIRYTKYLKEEKDLFFISFEMKSLLENIYKNNFDLSLMPKNVDLDFDPPPSGKKKKDPLSCKSLFKK